MTKNKILWMLISLVAAFLLWLYVITFISPESEETYTGIAVIDPAGTERVLDARGLMLLQEEPITVTLTLEGNRSDLAKLKASDLKIKVDYSNINNEGDKMEPNVEISWPDGTVGSDYIVKSMNPSPITVKVVRKSKDVDIPVKIEEMDEIPDGYVVKDFGCQEFVKVSGPTEIVSSIDHARLELRYNGQVQGLDGKYDVVLCNAKGEPVDTKWLTYEKQVVMVPEFQRQEVFELAVNVIDGAGATKDTSEITISPSAIVVTCSEDTMAKVEKMLTDGKLILGDIDLAEYLTDKRVTFELPDLGLKEGETVVSVDDEKSVDSATVLVKFPDLVKRDFIVTVFDPKYTPAGYSVEVLDEQISVTIRGPRDLMEQMKAENIKLVLDLSKAVAGENTVQATVVIMDNSITTADSTKETYDVLVMLEESEENNNAKGTDKTNEENKTQQTDKTENTEE